MADSEQSSEYAERRKRRRNVQRFSVVTAVLDTGFGGRPAFLAAGLQAAKKQGARGRK